MPFLPGAKNGPCARGIPYILYIKKAAEAAFLFD
jgi:hypothetical protein